VPYILDDEERSQAWYEARLDAYYDDMARYEPDEDCRCGAHSWECTEQTVYGDDADGNRGRPLRVYECRKCGNEQCSVESI